MTPPAKQSSERRQATVMFADISGFTAMSERMDPEEVTDLMNECFEMMGSIIQFYGGVIDKFIGDCVMAVFGVPVAIENAPTKAVNAAIELRKGVYRFAAQRQMLTPLDVHIGMNTGTVLAGRVGARDKKQFTVIGDAVNLASRLEDYSKPGQVLVGPATYHATSRDFEYREIGPVELKGKSKPVPVFELLSKNERLHRSRPVRERKVHSDMVGRQDELARLQGLVKGVVEGRGAVVNVVGEAGIGKSRLMAEVRARFEADSCRYLEGRAISIGRNLSFHPVVDLLRNMADVEEGDSDEVAVVKLQRFVDSVITQAETTELLPFVITLTGLELPSVMEERVRGIEGEALEKLIMRSLRVLVSRGAERRPLVICMEDMHWADGSSLALLEGLYHLVETHRVLFVNVFRPGFPETSERLLQAPLHLEGRCSVIALQSLDDERCNELLDNLIQVRGLPQITREIILRRADGNPFFIEEVVRSFIEQGAVVQRDGRFEITERIGQVEVPTSINDVIMARIDRLDRDTRELLKTASVLGRRFFRRILKEVLDTPLDTDEHLRILTESQFLQEQIRMQELEYLFKHALAQEVAYKSLLLQRRKQLHLRVARSIERVFANRLNDFYGMLAYHYSLAEEPEKAGRYMSLAGEEAARCSASIEALNYYQAAMDLVGRQARGSFDPDELLRLQENTGRAYFARGHYVEAVDYFERVLRQLGFRVARSRPRAVLRFGLGMLRLVQHLYLPTTIRRRVPGPGFNRGFKVLVDYVRALGCIDAAMFTLNAPEVPCRVLDVGVERVDRGVELLSSSSVGFCWSGASFGLARRILEYARHSGGASQPRNALYLRFGEVIYGFLAGDWSIPYDEAVVDRGYEKGELWHATTLLVFWVYTAIEQGRFLEVEAMLGKMERAAGAYNDRFVLSLQQQARAILLLQQRRLEEAQSAADATIAINIEIGQEVRNLSLYGLKARAQVVAGQLDQAEVSLVRAEALVARESMVIPFHHSNVLVGRCLLHLGRAGRGDAKQLGQARKALRRARRNARKVASEQVELLRLTGLGAWLGGRQGRAIRWWARALERGEQFGAPVELARTRHEAGLALDAEGSSLLVQGQDGASLVKQGAAELTALGVDVSPRPWWLDG